MFFKHIFRPARTYLDYASSTPIDTKMLRGVPSLPKNVAGANPHGLHKEGVVLRNALSDARRAIATIVYAQPDEIIFTSGATESDNLALLGAIAIFIKKGIDPSNIVVYSSDLEHAAVAETINHVPGLRHIILSSVEGVVNPKDIVVLPDAKAIIVSIMYVNNEIGTVQPIKDIAKRVRYLRKEHSEVLIIFHTDATQAPLHFSLNTAQLGVDLMTLGATKLYCPKGVGMLYKKRTVAIEPLMHGGGQEYGLRPGTEPVALIRSFAHALAYAQKIQEKETVRVSELQNYFESNLKKHFPQLNITAESQPRTPHISHVGVPDFDSELLVIELDARGIAVSAKSACRNDEEKESHIVKQLYGKGWGAVRFSFGRMTTKNDLTRVIAALGSIFEKYHT